MKGFISLRNIPAPLIGVSQRFFNLRVYPMQAIVRLRRRILSRDHRNQGKPIEYLIAILHKRAGFGKGVHFRSIYYVRERKDAGFIKHALCKAFHLAHPSWIIEEVRVEPIAA